MDILAGIVVLQALVEAFGETGIEAIWIAQRLDDVDVIEGHQSSLCAALQAKNITGVPSRSLGEDWRAESKLGACVRMYKVRPAFAL